MLPPDYGLAGKNSFRLIALDKWSVHLSDAYFFKEPLSRINFLDTDYQKSKRELLREPQGTIQIFMNNT